MFASLKWVLLASCITSVSYSEESIVGGSTVSASEHPYIAVILWNSGSLHCGGSILKKEYPAVIMTAAHCINSNMANKHFVRLYASDYNGQYDATSNKYKDVTIAQVVSHEDYIDADQGDDIALLVINEDISNVGRLQTVSIAPISPKPWSQSWSSGDDLLVVGYGHDYSGGSPTPFLEEVTVPYVLRSECKTYFTETIDYEMICAGAVGVDSCQGDSGGPLLVKGTDEQIGIVSWGYGCAASTPGLYTNVGVYFDWIQDKLASIDCLVESANEIEDDVDIGSDAKVYYQVSTDDATEQLTIYINVESGDADLYVRFGAAPTESAFDCRPYESHGSESCTFDPAQVGTYYIMIHAYSAVVGLSVTSVKSPCETTTTTTAAPTQDPTLAPTSYGSLFVKGKKVRLMAKGCDLCIYDREGSKKTNLADCDSGDLRLKWKLTWYNPSYLKFKIKNKETKKWMKKSDNGLLKTKDGVDNGHYFQFDYKTEGGVYYVEMREVDSDTCPQWNGCDDNSLQMVDCDTLDDSFNIRVLDIETSEIEPMPRSNPDLFIVDHYYNLTYLAIVFIALVFVYWATYILKQEHQRKECDHKVSNHDDEEETDGLMEDL